MSLVTLSDVLEPARREKYAVAAFDVSDYRMARAVVDVAEELRAPIILMGLKPDSTDDQFRHMAVTMKMIAEEASIPVCVHLDHATDLCLIEKAIEYGYSSVMYDGSVLPLDENIRKTKEVVELAKRHGVTVEAELGHVGDGIAGGTEGGEIHEGVLTDADEMEFFIESTGVDALAVSIGTAHGVYISRPELDLGLLAKLNQKSKIPLVLHGGSGTPDDAVQASVQLGICKINIFSEVLYSFFSQLKYTLNESENLSMWPSVTFRASTEAMKQVIKEKIITFGAVNKAL